MSVSVFVRSIVSAWAIRRVALLLCKIRLSMPKYCPKPSPDHHTKHVHPLPQNALSPTSTRANNRQRIVFPTRLAGEKHPRGARSLEQPCEPTTPIIPSHMPTDAHSFPILHSTDRASHEPVSAWALALFGDAIMQMHNCSAAGGRVPTVCKAEAVCFIHLACVYTFPGGMWSRAYIHIRVQQFLGLVGILTVDTAGVFMHASVLSVFCSGSCWT